MSAFQDEPLARGSVPAELRALALAAANSAVSMTFVGAPRTVAVGSVLRASGGPLHGRLVYVLGHEVLELRRARGGDDEDGDQVRQRLFVRPASAEESARVLAAEREQLYARFQGT